MKMDVDYFINPYYDLLGEVPYLNLLFTRETGNFINTMETWVLRYTKPIPC